MSVSSLILASVLMLPSPDGTSHARLSAGGGADAPSYQLEFEGRAVTQDAAMGIVVDGVALGAGSDVIGSSTGRVEERFPTRGNHREVSVVFNTLDVLLRDRASGREWRIEARMSDDAFAWRYLVPGKSTDAQTLVGGEASAFRPVDGCRVWLSERPNDWKLKSYAGYWMRAEWADLPHVSKAGPVQCPPLVVELPGGGWVVFTEAGLRDYSGMRLRASGDGIVRADFTEGAKGFSVRDDVVSPWRVVKFAKSLNALVNTTDLLEALSPPPDATLFTDGAPWVRSGRAVWHWWSKRRAGTPAQELQMTAWAAQLGFEYSLVDEGWRDWQEPWTRVRELTAAARKQDVGILLWLHMKDVMNPENGYGDLRAFLDRTAEAGAAGVKVDFFNAETKEMVDLQTAIVREAAKRKLVVLFHGCQKPTGETRTWPNQLTREGIRGLELNGMAEGPITAEHNCALPFTRLAVGPGDYTPVGFSSPGATTWAHQLATAVAFLSPLQVIAEYPQVLFEDARCAPALDLLKAVPTEWDETRVLEPSKIGECTMIARRLGNEWWIGAICAQPVKVTSLDLSFLGDGVYRGVLIESGARATEAAPLRRTELERVVRESRVRLELARGDGAVLRLTPVSEDVSAVKKQPLAVVPEMTRGEPAPGKRVRQTEPEYAGTDVHHSLYLPPEYDGHRKLGLIVELTGNYFPVSASTGEVSGAHLGFAATLGKDFAWIALPYVAKGGKSNERIWWGDEKATVEYAKLCVKRTVEKYHIDTNRIVLCGFSRGAVGVGYIGLYDDEIAGLWSAFMTHDHFDGVNDWRNTEWGTPLEKYRTEAAVRLRRLRGRPFWVGQNGGTRAIEEFLKERDLLGVARFQFETIPINSIFPVLPNGVVRHAHTDLWPLFESDSAERLREWLKTEVPAGAH